MKRKKIKIPLHKITAVLKGIAVIFYSTGFYFLAIEVAYSSILFAQLSDKPDHHRPRCRSPPVLLFRFPKINENGGLLHGRERKAKGVLRDGGTEQL